MNVASYCVFGKQPHYRLALAGIIRAHHHIFPGWQLWLHHDEKDVRHWQGYVREGLLRLVDCRPFVDRGRAMLWRMKPIWEKNVDYVICRDMDSLPMVRDRRMVEVFMATNCIAHTEADHAEHTAPFMGGMCGFHAPRFRSITYFDSWDQFIVAGYNDLAAPTGGADQIHLYEVLWPRLERLTCHHRVRATTGAPMRSPHIYYHIDDLPLLDVSETIQAEADTLSEYVGYRAFTEENAADTLARTKAFYAQHGEPKLMARIERAEL